MLPEALRVAREHCNYCALQGLSPVETLKMVGLRPRLGHQPNWFSVEQEIGLQWLRLADEVDGVFSPKENDGYWREAA